MQICHAANSVPTLTAPKTVNVTVGVTTEFSVTATDTDAADTTVVYLVSVLPAGATFDNVTGNFTWTPQDSTDVNITYVQL